MKANSPAATLVVVATVQFLTPFMFSAVGVALPTIGRDFSANGFQLGLVEMVYILAVALFLLPIGRFADIYGRRKIFISGAVVITLATLVLSLSSTIQTFILYRFFQGIGAAMITATSLAILTSVYPSETRGKAYGIVVCCVYLGLSAGPTLAGLMTTYLSWRWIFYAAVPVESLALIVAILFLKGEWSDAAGETFDWFGSLLYISALASLILGITHLKEWENSLWITVAGCTGMLLFTVYQYLITSPLISIQALLKNSAFALNNLATWINYAASFGVVFFFSIYLQTVKGLSPKDAGMILVIQPLIQAAIAPVAGRLADKYAPDLMATIGMMICTVALLTASSLSGDSTFGQVILVLIFLGTGFGLFATPNTTAVMASVSPRDYGMASSMVATMRSTGMLTSMTIITTVLSIYLGDNAISETTSAAFLQSMQTALLSFSALSLIGVGCSMARFPFR